MFSFSNICKSYINLPATVAIFSSFFLYNTGVVHTLIEGQKSTRAVHFDLLRMLHNICSVPHAHFIQNMLLKW